MEWDACMHLVNRVGFIRIAGARACAYIDFK